MPMTLPTHDSNAAAGIAMLTAIAAVGNPRSPPASSRKQLILDVQIYIGSATCESLTGALNYFNGSDTPFESDTVSLFLIHATVGQAIYFT